MSFLDVKTAFTTSTLVTNNKSVIVRTVNFVMVIDYNLSKNHSVFVRSEFLNGKDTLVVFFQTKKSVSDCWNVLDYLYSSEQSGCILTISSQCRFSVSIGESMWICSLVRRLLENHASCLVRRHFFKSVGYFF